MINRSRSKRTGLCGDGIRDRWAARRPDADRLARGRGHPGGAAARPEPARQAGSHRRSPRPTTPSEAVILDGLARLMPGIPVVSEETTGNRPVDGLGSRFVIVDPLDGTREFLAGLDEFTVNIALIENGTPVAGVVAAPARGLIWRGYVGHGAERLALAPGAAPNAARERVAIRTRARPASGARVLISRSHLDAATDAYVDRLPQPERIACGSALKFCLLAEGSADLYPRLGADIGMGHRGRPRRAGRRRRRRAQAGRQRAALWPGRVSASPASSPSATRPRRAPNRGPACAAPPASSARRPRWRCRDPWQRPPAPRRCRRDRAAAPAISQSAGCPGVAAPRATAIGSWPPKRGA